MILYKVEATIVKDSEKENWNRFEWREWIYGQQYSFVQTICLDVKPMWLDYAVVDAKWNFQKKRVEIKGDRKK